MKNKILHIFTLIFVLALAASCSNSKTKKFLSHIPADADAVVVGEIKTVFESAGGKVKDGKIILPDYINDNLTDDDYDDLDEMSDFIRQSGIDMEACAYFNKDGRDFVVFHLDDKNKFINYIEDNDFRQKREDDGVEYFVKKQESEYISESLFDFMAIDGDFAYSMSHYWASDSKKPMKELHKTIDEVKDNSMKDIEAAKFMTDGNAVGALISVPKEGLKALEQLGLGRKATRLVGMIALKGNLNDHQLTFDIKIFDREGNNIDKEEIADVIDFEGKINPEALDYLHPNDIFAFAMYMDPDRLKSAIRQSMEKNYGGKTDFLKLFNSSLQKMEGTVAIGLGIKNGIDGLWDASMGDMDSMDITIVIEAREGKAVGLINDLKAYMQSDDMIRNIKSEPGEFSASFVTGGHLYAKAKGNFVILSSSQPTLNKNLPITKAVDFGDYPFAMALDLESGNRLLRDLNIENSIKCSVTSDISKLQLSITLDIEGGKEKGLIEKAANIILDIVDQERDLDSRYEQAPERRIQRESAYYEEAVEAIEAMEVQADTVVAGVKAGQTAAVASETKETSKNQKEAVAPKETKKTSKSSQKKENSSSSASTKQQPAKARAVEAAAPPAPARSGYYNSNSGTVTKGEPSY